MDNKSNFTFKQQTGSLKGFAQTQDSPDEHLSSKERLRCEIIYQINVLNRRIKLLELESSEHSTELIKTKRQLSIIKANLEAEQNANLSIGQPNDSIEDAN